MAYLLFKLFSEKSSSGVNGITGLVVFEVCGDSWLDSSGGVVGITGLVVFEVGDSWLDSSGGVGGMTGLVVFEVGDSWLDSPGVNDINGLQDVFCD